jgi:cytochrome c oxidase subunit 2
MKLFATLFSFLMMAVPASAVEPTGGYADSWQLNLQPAISPMKAEIYDFHNLLLVIITAITVVVTLLLLYAAFKFRRKKDVEPAKFAHNTLIEVIWTIVPVVILIIIAIPSFKLLYFEDRIPEPELTIKTTGYQWYWGYEYMDYDGLEFLSYPIPEDEIDESKGQRRLLSTDAPVVVPIDTNIQLLVTAADVLHAFALPAAGVKKDAVPGRLNETWMRIDKPGTYFGQCSEICGTGHSYMPIEVIAVTKEEFDAWTRAQGGKLKPKAIEQEKEI